MKSPRNLEKVPTTVGTSIGDRFSTEPAGEHTMQAIVQNRYGSSEVLELAEIDTPVVGDDEVLVRVRAASVSIGDWLVMNGLPYIVRVMGYGLRAPKVRVRGTDLAGRVEVVGKNVAQLQPGDEVFGSSNGAFAEYVASAQVALALKPANMTFEQAAAVPTSAFTALQALRDKGEVEPGQKVLIIGASGGVGTFAVQIAKAFGAEVTGVCSTRNVDLVRSLGADHVIDYTREDITSRGERYDVVLDTAGNRSLARLRRALAPRGTLVIVGGDGGRWLMGSSRTLRALVMSPFVRQRLRAFIAMANQKDLVVIKELIEAGKLTPVVDRAYPLSEVPDAISYVGERHTQGRVVITV